jgi:hypothetical protein
MRLPVHHAKLFGGIQRREIVTIETIRAPDATIRDSFDHFTKVDVSKQLRITDQSASRGTGVIAVAANL